MNNDVTQEKENTTLIIRDRRGRSQFSIHNRIIDQWFPIIGPHGYALYSLYVRMADLESERSYPSLRMIASHMGMGQSTISDYNRLLAWCKLIYIQEGTRNKSNTYYILDIPEVTDETLKNLHHQIDADIERRRKQTLKKAKDLKKQAKKIVIKTEKEKLLTRVANLEKKARSSTKPPFLKTIVQRLKDWQPIQVHWNKPKAKTIIPVIPARAQPLLFSDTPQSENGKPPNHHTNNLLEHIGIIGKNASILASQSPEIILAWYWSILLEGMDEKYIPGYIVNQLKTNTPPPSTTADLANRWLLLDRSDRDIFRAHVDNYSTTGTAAYDSFADSLPADFMPDLYEESLNAFYKLFKTNSYFTDW